MVSNRDLLWLRERWRLEKLIPDHNLIHDVLVVDWVDHVLVPTDCLRVVALESAWQDLRDLWRGLVLRLGSHMVVSGISDLWVRVQGNDDVLSFSNRFINVEDLAGGRLHILVRARSLLHLRDGLALPLYQLSTLSLLRGRILRVVHHLLLGVRVIVAKEVFQFIRLLLLCRLSGTSHVHSLHLRHFVLINLSIMRSSDYNVQRIFDLLLLPI